MSYPNPTGRASFDATPNGERYLLESETLRRRQLHAALLHGSRGTWRERRRIWLAVIGGLAVAAVIVAAIAVAGAFQQQQRINEEQRQQRQQPRPAVTVSPPAAR